ncbi:MAG TPA: four helix bundle protein [Flavobacteriales bacterium]|nr:four helix bundle protein [Flavobacteriales bacterium]
MNNYKNLMVWKKAVDLSISIYRTTASFSAEEMYGLTSQMRKAAVSISANIAEGAGRNSSKEFNQLLGIANGSTNELETLTIIACELDFIKQDKKELYLQHIVEIQKMIRKLKESLQMEKIKKKMQI